jgi:hypothetical protein
MLKWLKTAVNTCVLLMLTSCQPTQSASTRINANHYDSFWIWGNIQSAPYLVQSKELYILQGEIRYSKQKQSSVLIPQGISIRKLPHQKIWLVFRTHHLKWDEQNYQTIFSRMEHWKNQGNQVQGLQIDFDSQTNNLKDYAIFLEKLRQQLPAKYKLSITGLLDWTNVKDQNTLHILRQNIDELVLQSYQGTTTIPNYREYLKRISSMQLPYKIGLVQHGIWQTTLNQPNDRFFRGYVVFLLRPKT